MKRDTKNKPPVALGCAEVALGCADMPMYSFERWRVGLLYMSRLICASKETYKQEMRHERNLWWRRGVQMCACTPSRDGI